MFNSNIIIDTAIQQFLFYLNTIVKDFLPDYVALLGRGDNIQESVRSKMGGGPLLFHKE